MNRMRPLLAIIALLGIVGFTGCSDDDGDNNPPAPALTVEIQVAPATPTTGANVTLTAQVTGSTVSSVLWEASAGVLTDPTAESTVWVAPDNDGTYEITVLVGDGTNSATSKKSLVVSDYVPAEDPHYVGASTCQACHSGTYTSWSATGHAGALETLAAEGQDRNASCLACHTVGFDATVANGGYDETAVPRLKGVQCENCHAPGSAHPTGGTPKLPVDKDAALCGGCHEGAHHPTYSEWQESAHGGPLLASPAMRGGSSQCMKCHNGLYAGEYLDDPEGFTTTETPTDSIRIVCVVCHDPHGNGNKAYLRNAVNDIAIPEGTHPQAGAGRLCIACHNGRRAPTDIEGMINDGSSHFGPHHSVQGDMLTGEGAYENVAPGFTFASSRHISIQDGCVTCHNHHIPWVAGGEAYTGHSFEPKVEACAPCHGAITEFTGVIAKDDYDGDGTVEGVQDEVIGLMHNLEQTIIEATPADSVEDRAALQAALDAGEFDAAVGNIEYTTIEQRKSGYNLFYVEFDRSKGVHNATYGIQLLQQSILALDPGKASQMRILVE